jgi:hypothetical protein
VQDDINEEGENPAAVEDKGAVDSTINDERIMMGTPQFVKTYSN